MPTWTLSYSGRDCTLFDVEQELSILRSDPACVRMNTTESVVEPGVINVEIEFHFGITMSTRSADILRLRWAQAVPMVPTIPLDMSNRIEILMELGEHQENETLQVGLPVCIDEQGRVGLRGAPLGILMHVDRENNQARIRIQPGSPVDALPPPPMRIEEFNQPPQFNREGLEQARLEVERRIFPLPDPRVQQAHQQILADEDARILAVLDSIALGSTRIDQEPLRPPSSKSHTPEPRPTFKTRYERIMDALKGK